MIDMKYKFRGIGTDSKLMHYGDLIQEGDKFFIRNGKIEILDFSGTIKCDCTLVDKDTVGMQVADELDGGDAYEGDIILWFNEDYQKWDMFVVDKQDLAGLCPSVIYSGYLVIGNIYSEKHFLEMDIDKLVELFIND